MARLIHSVHAAYRPHSLSSQLTAFSYLPKTVNTLILPVDICHLKQTVLIRSSTKCKYQSGQPQHTARKTHYMRQNAVSSTLLSQSRDFFYISCRNVVCPLPETRQIQNKTKFKAFLLVSLWGLGGFFFLEAHNLGCGAWPKTAVTNVSLQQQMSIHNSWGWIWVYSRIAFGQSAAKDSIYPLPEWKDEIKHLIIWLTNVHGQLLYRSMGAPATPAYLAFDSISCLWHRKKPCFFPSPSFLYKIGSCTTVHYFWHAHCSALPLGFLFSCKEKKLLYISSTELFH